MDNNYLQGFLVEDLDIRGTIVHLDSVWQKMLAGRKYPSPVMQILGEMTATTLLFSSNLKQRGRLTIQLTGSGPISLLVIDCNENLHIRGMAKCGKIIEVKPVPELLGHGRLVLTLDMVAMREVYQSIVPLEGNNITAIFEHYLKQSEQLNSRLILATTMDTTAGLFFQKLPNSALHDPDGWARIEALVATVKHKELLSLPAEDLLHHLFNHETIRIYEPQRVIYGCQKNWEKVHSLLRALGREEVDSILQEFGEVVINDEICNHEYRFDALAIYAVFRKMNSTVH